MQIYIIYDHNINVSETTLKTYFSNIVGFLNVYLQFSEDNSFYFINNKTIIFDSTQNNNLNEILKFKIIPITAGDIAIALLRKCNFILLCTMFPETFNLKNIIQCIKTAKTFKIPIHTFGITDSNTLKLISQGTHGKFIFNDFYNLVQILDLNTIPILNNFGVNCYCCNKTIYLGFCCSICLTIYCKFIPICKKCKIKFNFIN
ncbi:RNA polymerase II transcription initiation/nucleotide excision repair factor TFIIH, subunit TFB4 [Enterocytozoon bieneusi H348]|nr:RNA polymerase II transcription initiation/nucleotide excision repair factor TFIIH, subunit TFB4 [Enterocytozoon bieneusi H348]|eukprot:XP_002649763.1 RNA polymerase II transcription initiation/nucleotide excision repair factor TFIIH, subunit TFB4 [Enterocytozoon bieneusi H348]